MLINLSNEPFAMEPGALEAFAAKIERIESGAVKALSDATLAKSAGYSVSEGTAVIPVVGVLLKSDSDAEMYRCYGEDATGYGEIADAIDAAEADPSVARIQLAIDSPGGQVAGIHAISDRIHQTVKPVTAHVDTLCASAAYWIASQADEITAPRGAQVGSIGAYVAVVDISQRAAQAGIKVHVISSGPYKGAGVPGAEIKPEHLADMQGRINKIHGEFVQDINRGRSVRGADPTRINESANGRVYSSLEAVQIGLIDRISSDPEKERKMAEAAAVKDFAALVKAHPEHAALIAEKAEAGEAVAAVRVAIEKAKADKAAADKVAALEKEAADAKAKADAVAADLAAAQAKTAELEKALADEKAAREALAKLGAGAKPAEGVKADPPKAQDNVKKASEIEAMGGIERARFFQAGGKMVDG